MGFADFAWLLGVLERFRLCDIEEQCALLNLVSGRQPDKVIERKCICFVLVQAHKGIFRLFLIDHLGCKMVSFAGIKFIRMRR